MFANTVNCWNTLRAAQADWAISSQAFWQQDEGSTTRSWSLGNETVKAHERGALGRGDDIVWAAVKAVEARIKSLAITLPTNVASFPRWVLDATSDLGSETAAMTSVALETTQVSATGAEIGIFRRITDGSIELTTIGMALFDFLIKDTATLMAVSLDDDICALFPSISTSVGATTVNLTLANMVEAQATVRKQLMRGTLVYVLDDQQALDYQVAQAAATSTTINGLMSPSVDGSTDSAYLGTFFMSDVWQTGLCDTATTGADVVGACFINGATNPTTAWGGACMVRDVRTEMARPEIEKRETKFVGTAKWGVCQIAAESGVKIVTDA